MKFPRSATRWVVAGVVAVTVGGGVYAFADSLTVTSDSISAGSTLIPAGCSQQAHVSYAVAFNPNQIGYVIAAVDVTTDNPLPGAQSACAGRQATVTLTGINHSATGPFPLTLAPATLDSQGRAHFTVGVSASVQDFTDVHVAIS